MSLFREEVFEGRRARLHGEVILSQPLSTRMFVTALLLIIVVAGAWISSGTYSRVETVPGLLVTDIPSAKVVAMQNGIVSELPVIEGQNVEKGDRLLVINSDRQVTSGGDVAGRSLDAVKARRQLSETRLALVDNRASAERSRLLTVINSTESQAADLREQIALQEQVVDSNQRIFAQISEVVEQGFVSKVEYERRRQTMLNAQQSLSGLRQRLSANLGEAEQARAQLAAANIEAAQNTSTIQEGLQTLSAEEARLEGEQSYVITAPIGGRVSALATGLGRPANAGRPLMIIVPDNAQLEAELYAPTRAVGMVAPGKETRLLYDAFPYQKFGSFLGTISSISRIAVDPRETEIPFPFEEPVYRVRVTLHQQDVEAYGEASSLQPGMTLKANIILERQSFLNWILEPLNAVINRNS